MGAGLTVFENLVVAATLFWSGALDVEGRMAETVAGAQDAGFARKMTVKTTAGIRKVTTVVSIEYVWG